MSPKKAAQTSVRRTTGTTSQLLTPEERAVMRETLNDGGALARGRRTRKETYSRRSPRCRNRIASWPSDSMPSSKPPRRL